MVYLAEITEAEKNLQEFELKSFEIEHAYWSVREKWTEEENRQYDGENYKRTRKRKSLEKSVKRLKKEIKPLKNGLLTFQGKNVSFQKEKRKWTQNNLTTIYIYSLLLGSVYLYLYDEIISYLNRKGL